MSPRVSVVVPMFNVAAYLEDCLTSLAQQTLADIEVVMVDDGSTDETPDIARRVAAADSRFRLISQPNGGLGNARNTGTTAATGEFLAFVDSDDVVPRHAYETLLAALDKSGSDFASGNVRRLSSLGISQATFLANVFQRARTATHVTKFPALIADRTAWNKLFRRSFWDEHKLRFPEGVLYEDMPVTVPAHFLARSVDVVDRTVYLWRVRESGDRSITQQRTDLRALRDRAAAVDSVSRFLAERGLEDAKRTYDTSVLRDDLRYFLDVLGAADADYRQMFLSLANDYLDRADPDVADSLPALQRLKWLLVRRRALDELLVVLEFQETALERTPPVRRRGRWYGDYPFRRDRRFGIPRDVYRLDEELTPVVVLDRLHWDDTGALVITGHAYIEMLGAPSRRAQTVTVHVSGGDSSLASVRARPVHRPDVTADVSSAYASLDWSGFEAVVPADRLPGATGLPSSVGLAIEVSRAGVTRRTRRPEWATTVAPAAPTRRVGERDLRARIGSDGRLTAAIVDPRVTASVCRHDNGVLQIEGSMHAADRDGAELLVGRRAGTAELRYPLYVEPAGDRPAFVGRLPLAELVAEVEVADEAGHSEAQGEGVVWDVFVAGASRRRMALPASVPELTWSELGRELSVQRSRYGYLAVVARSPRPIVTDARWSSPGELVLEGSFHAPATGYELVLRRRRASDEHACPFEVGADGHFAVTLAVTGITSGIGAWSLPTGRWDLAVRRREDPLADPVDVVLDHAVLDRLPVSSTVDSRNLRFGVAGYDRPLLVVEPDLRDDERGGFGQRRLEQRHYPAQRRRPVRDAVLYLCLDGTEFAGSPRAIHEELARRGSGLEHLWVVRDGRFTVPPGVTAVRADSSDYFDALARARFVVADDYLPEIVEPRRGQTFVQTWHGSPVKRLGAELGDAPGARRAYRRFAEQRAPVWQHVLSASPTMTEVVRRAFPFVGEVHETGLPRADLLHRADAEAVAADVRRRLQIPDGRRVALYAPTYRDQLGFGRNRYRLGQTLDVDVLRASLGEEWVILFRRHRDVLGRLSPVGDPFVRDVSYHPAPDELLLAADVLVTDYSSLLFDQVTLDRPVIFFTPDLENYRDHVRGFTIPFEDEAPGPLVQSTEEVGQALRGLEALRTDYAGRRDAARAKYCPLDDGRAAGRVVDALFDH